MAEPSNDLLEQVALRALTIMGQPKTEQDELVLANFVTILTLLLQEGETVGVVLTSPGKGIFWKPKHIKL